MDRELELDTVASRLEAAAVLEAVAGGVSAGTLRVDDPDAPFDLTVPETLGLDIDIEIEEGDVELELELDWETDDGDRSVAPVAATDESDGTADDADLADAAVDTTVTTVEDGDGTAVPVTALFGAAPAEMDDGDIDSETAETTASNEVDADGAGEGEGKAKSRARFELFTDAADEWRWRLRHHNGNVIATSGEGYTRKANARKGLASVVANAPGAVVVEK